MQHVIFTDEFFELARTAPALRLCVPSSSRGESEGLLIEMRVSASPSEHDWSPSKTEARGRAISIQAGGNRGFSPPAPRRTCRTQCAWSTNRGRNLSCLITATVQDRLR